MLSFFVDPVALCGSPHRNVISVPKESKKLRMACFLLSVILSTVITTLMASKSDEITEGVTLNLDEIVWRHVSWIVLPISGSFVAPAPLEIFISTEIVGYPN